MSITAANLRTEANQRSGREWTEAQITIALKSLLHDMAKDNLLESTTYLAVTAGTPNYAITNAKKLIVAQFYDVSAAQYSKPMKKITWGQYREEVGKNLSNSVPTKVTFYRGSIYVSAPPDTTNDRIYYTVLLKHADSISSVSFEDDTRECLVQGLSYYCYELVGLQNTEKAKIHLGKYENEKGKLSGDIGIGRISKVKYRDM